MHYDSRMFMFTDKYVEWMTKLTPYFLEAEKLIYKESKKNSKDSEELQEVSLRGLTID